MRLTASRFHGRELQISLQNFLDLKSKAIEQLLKLQKFLGVNIRTRRIRQIDESDSHMTVKQLQKNHEF